MKKFEHKVRKKRDFYQFVLFSLGDKWADSDEDSNPIDINASHSSRRRLNEQPTRDNTAHNPNR